MKVPHKSRRKYRTRQNRKVVQKNWSVAMRPNSGSSVLFSAHLLPVIYFFRLPLMVYFVVEKCITLRPTCLVDSVLQNTKSSLVLDATSLSSARPPFVSLGLV